MILAITLFSNRLFTSQIEGFDDSQFKMIRAIVEFNLRSAEDRGLARADMLVNLPKIKTLFAAQDRQGLLDETKEMFRNQSEKYGVDQAQFHVPPATSFLRLHAPEKFGDDLSVRPLVVKVNKEKLANKGVTISRTGPGICGIVPISDAEGKHVGSFEFVMDFGPVLDKLKAAYNLDSSLFFDEQLLKETATGVSGDVFNEQNRLGKYVKFHSTNWDLMRQLVGVSDLSGQEKRGEYTQTALSVPYGVVIVPLRNAAGVPIGLIATSKDFSSSQGAIGKVWVLQITMAIFAIVLISGVVLVVIRGFLIRPLVKMNTIFGTLAKGDAKGTMEEEILCEEIKDLNYSYELLRKLLIGYSTKLRPQPAETTKPKIEIPEGK